MSERPRGADGATAVSPVTRHPSGRREAALLLLLAMSVGCSERLTPSHAGTIIRHSKAFLSGSPESHPVLDGVTALLKGSEGWTPERQEGDSYVAQISYHWPLTDGARDSGQPVATLTASVVLHRLGNSWAVDDDGTKALIPSWPQLPRTLNPFAPGPTVRP
jgi:hypothetical protein